MNTHAQQEALTFLDSWLAYRAQQLVDIPGFAVAIMDGDRVVFSRAYGMADLETQQPLTTEHMFSTASHTKMFTATVVLQLAAAGTLSLDKSVCTYLPWLAGHPDSRMREITIRQLLCHGAGLIRDGEAADYWQLERPFPTRAMLHRTVLAAPLALEPNTQPKYSNLGYALLGEVVETVIGKPWASSVQQIIRAAGLASTTPDYTPGLAQRLVAGHALAFAGKRLPLRRRTTAGALAASVGVCATAEDMCRFAGAHFWGATTLLDHAWQKEAQRSQMAVIHGYDSGTAFGLGFELLACGDRQLVGHSGHLAGQSTATWFDPRAGLAVAVFANAKGAPSTTIAKGIFQALDHFEAHTTHPTPAHLARLQGRLYSHLAVVQIVAAGDVLVAIDPDDWEPFTWPEELAYVGPTQLRIVTRGSVFGEGEAIRYRFVGDTMHSVRYAGTRLLPEIAYQQLRSSQG